MLWQRETVRFHRQSGTVTLPASIQFFIAMVAYAINERMTRKMEIRELVLRIANDNLDWGYTKIRDALRGVGVSIGRTTVVNYLAEIGMVPAPERTRKRTWKQFLTIHLETLYACDFFSVEALGITGTVRYMVFFVIEIKTRAVAIHCSRKRGREYCEPAGLNAWRFRQTVRTVTRMQSAL